MPADKPVIIVGGGWAGLSAAVHLTRRGQAVTLIEAAEQLGGRARMVMFGDLPADNGQHIALGAYRNILQLLDMIGLDESLVFCRQPLSLTVKGTETRVTLKTSRLPAPFHLLLAFLKTEGLTASDKLKTIIHWPRLIGMHADKAMTVTELLHKTGQSARVIHYLWNPLCIAALNTNPEIASARVFQRVLRDALARQRADSDLLLPRHDMGRVLPQPTGTWLTQHGARILTQERATRLLHDGNTLTGIRTNKQTLECDQLILATNAWSTAQLMDGIEVLRPLQEKLLAFEYEPIATVFLKYAHPVRHEPAMLGLADATTQWIFDRRITGHPQMLAAVISARGEHARMSKNELLETVIRDIRDNTPLQDDPVDTLVIREKRATFSSTPAAELIRPDNTTAVKGLTIAGDYTQTGYPATLEGAVISGKQASACIP